MFPLIVMLASLAAGQAPKTAAKPHDAKNGKKLYTNYGCYQCHGRDGQGSSQTGPRLGPKPMEFTAFVAYVRHPSAEMPPYTGKIVSDAELADIYAFLESLPQPPAVKTIPLLNDSPK
jgi:mono/diheme cytochrome c family protein